MPGGRKMKHGAGEHTPYMDGGDGGKNLLVVLMAVCTVHVDAAGGIVDRGHLQVGGRRESSLLTFCASLVPTMTMVAQGWKTAIRGAITMACTIDLGCRFHRGMGRTATAAASRILIAPPSSGGGIASGGRGRWGQKQTHRGHPSVTNVVL